MNSNNRSNESNMTEPAMKYSFSKSAKKSLVSAAYAAAAMAIAAPDQILTVKGAASLAVVFVGRFIHDFLKQLELVNLP
jgi:hypothetical protein